MTDSNETWKAIPGFSRYEASKGRPGEPGQVRNLAGQILSTGRSNRGRVTVTMTGDDGKRGPVQLSIAILTAHRGQRPPGQQGCHLDDNPDHNWLDNLMWGTPAENEAHKAANGNAVTPKPSYPCLNAPECDGKALHEGRRCTRCTHLAGLDIAARVSRRENLYVIADEYGFGVEWAWRLAVQHGDVTVSKREALTQQPPWSQRVARRLALRRASLRVMSQRGAGGDAT
jgi:hypothetical protein